MNARDKKQTNKQSGQRDGKSTYKDIKKPGSVEELRGSINFDEEEDPQNSQEKTLAEKIRELQEMLNQAALKESAFEAKLEEQRMEAEEQRMEAEAQRMEAEAQRMEAEAQRTRAQQAEIRAQQAEAELEAERQEAAIRAREEIKAERKEAWAKIKQNFRLENTLPEHGPSTIANVTSGLETKIREEMIVIAERVPDISVSERPTVMCPVFGGFARRVDDTEISEVNLELQKEVIKLAPQLRGCLKSELSRRSIIQKLLEKASPSHYHFYPEFRLYLDKNQSHLEPNALQGSSKIAVDLVGTSDTFDVKKNDTTTCRTKAMKFIPELIVEVKNEIGVTKSEPVVQAMSYYKRLSILIASIKHAQVNPSILLIVTGRIINVYGAVTYLREMKGERRYLAEILYTFTLDEEFAVLKLCKLLHVLAQCIGELSTYRRLYKEFPYSLCIPMPVWQHEPSPSPEFTLTTVTNKLVYINGTIVWKLARRYSQDAHLNAVELEIAPPFTFYRVCNNEWCLVIMEKVEGVLLSDCPDITDSEAWNYFIQQFKIFSQRFVHGDLRSPNIIYGSLPGVTKKQYYMLDFEFAGLHNECFYPHNLNTQLEWHETVRPLGAISPEHDLFHLQRYSTITF